FNKKLTQLKCEPNSCGATRRSDQRVEELVEGAVWHVLDDDEIHEATRAIVA
ncbi:hypothetical protein PIB30_078297, partial [Stylosanthes scabra]|nr:hypothetical protein [Stylosanthes scabra]